MTKTFRPFYGWWIVAVSAITLLLAGGIGLYSFGAFFTPLIDEFGWSRAQISLAMSIMGLVGFTGPLVGTWVDRYGARKIMVLGALLMSISFTCLGFTFSIYYFYALYFIVAAGQIAILNIPVLAVVSHWFDKRRGLAMGISVAGLGLGGLIMLPLSARLIYLLGWQWTYHILGLIICSILLPLIVLVIKNTPHDIGTLPDGEKFTDQEKYQRKPIPESDIWKKRWTLPKAMQTSVFWILVLAFMMVLPGTISIITHAVPFFVGQGFGNQLASTILGSAVGVSILGRVITGYLSDRIPIKYVTVLVFLFQVVGLLVLIFPVTPVSIPVFIAIFILSSRSPRKAGEILSSKF